MQFLIHLGAIQRPIFGMRVQQEKWYKCVQSVYKMLIKSINNQRIRMERRKYCKTQAEKNIRDEKFNEEREN